MGSGASSCGLSISAGLGFLTLWWQGSRCKLSKKLRESGGTCVAFILSLESHAVSLSLHSICPVVSLRICLIFGGTSVG